MTSHSLFITLAYGLTFLGCFLLVLATWIRGHQLRKRLKQLSNDSPS